MAVETFPFSMKRSFVIGSILFISLLSVALYFYGLIGLPFWASQLLKISTAFSFLFCMGICHLHASSGGIEFSDDTVTGPDGNIGRGAGYRTTIQLSDIDMDRTKRGFERSYCFEYLIYGKDNLRIRVSRLGHSRAEIEKLRKCLGLTADA